MQASFRGALAGIVAAVCVSTAVVASSPGVAEARAHYESAYGFDRTWNSALRLLRVDLGFKVVEKDEASGYVLFEYRTTENGNKVTSGSLELVGGRERGDGVQVVAQLPEMPRYHEQNLIDQLSRKLRTEYGDPPAKPRPPVKDAGDAGSDAGT